jgi:excisionase family DNA binding protein
MEPAPTQAAGVAALLRPEDVAAALCVDVAALKALVKDGAFPAPLLLGPGVLRWHPDAYAAWLEARIAGTLPAARVACCCGASEAIVEAVREMRSALDGVKSALERLKVAAAPVKVAPAPAPVKVAPDPAPAGPATGGVDTTPTHLTTDQACEFLQVGRTTLYKLLDKGLVRRSRKGRIVRWSRRSLEEFLKKSESK